MRRGMAVALPALGLILGACVGPRVQELSLAAADFSFTPSTLEVTAGVPVRLTMMNQGTLEHDFSILEIPMETMAATSVPMEGHDMTDMGEQVQLHMAAAVGMSNTIEFTPTKPGTYEFFCTVPGHKGAGMVGTMTVHSR